LRQESLFEDQDGPVGKLTPLAARMRPRALDEIVGQEHLIGPGRVLRQAIEADRVGSMVFWGPPGSGKTTLAEVIANTTRARFVGLSAVSAGVADVRKVIQEADRARSGMGRRTILFLDEIHRFSKSQQDAVLQAVERGIITLIGATTENPSFEVNSALLSRCRVYTLRPLTEETVGQLILRALADPERGLGSEPITLDAEARTALVRLSGGDARTALNALELAASVAPSDAEGRRHITQALVEDAMQRQVLMHDRAGDMHYDVVSAFIKSMRGSDPDGTLYWLARMIEAGEDPLFIVRRMVLLAAEDVGLADPQALVLAVAAQQAVHLVGMPEGYLPLSEVAIYLAMAPKSNSSYAAYGRARAEVQATGTQPVPLHLRNAVTGLMRALDYGKGYDYIHDFSPVDPARFRQRYLPDGVEGGYFEPRPIGYEARLVDRLKAMREARVGQRGKPPG
jgi:putative ATPase